MEYFEEDTSVHFRLRDGSPITRVINGNRRRGTNLGLGHTVFSLAALGKFTVRVSLQTVPEENRRCGYMLIFVSSNILTDSSRNNRNLARRKTTQSAGVHTASNPREATIGPRTR